MRLLFTKVEEATYSKQLRKLQPMITVVSEPSQATHCITTAELKRTPKLMMAMNSGVRYIVTEQWLQDCIKAGNAVDVVEGEDLQQMDEQIRALAADVTVTADSAVFDELRRRYTASLDKSRYLLRDADKEKLWNFNMPSTLARLRISHTLRGVRGSKEGVFSGYGVYVTGGICGKTAPSAEEMQQIVESGDGIWISNLHDYADALTPGKAPTSKGGKAAAKKKGAPAAAPAAAPLDNQEAMDPAKKPFQSVIVISHASVAKKELSNDLVNIIIASGALGVYTVEVVFQAVLRQELDLRENFLDPYRFT